MANYDLKTIKSEHFFGIVDITPNVYNDQEGESGYFNWGFTSRTVVVANDGTENIEFQFFGSLTDYRVFGGEALEMKECFEKGLRVRSAGGNPSSVRVFVW